ncbi:hypothetical protein KI688_003146 [Linnemannia hyalina]|uniref:ArnT-like N-terminal domain-containing protein n=1 Tax=Linnemannia hyalina TaxID=64524 RepID=A0A9P8BQF3_9FUNG|nr:hypothetical protein KI688_003146 [Linnemannia hyalina]
MAKKHNSPKKSKQKNNNQGGVSITNPAVFSPQDGSTSPQINENDSSGGLLRSTSFASSHASLSSLTDLDHEPSGPLAEAKQQLSSSEKTKKPSPAVTARQSRLSQMQRQSQETEGDDLWSWITATHPSVPSPRSAPTSLDPASKHQHQNDDDGTQERKQAKSSWYETQRQESLRLRGRDWVTLSALTVATMSVRLWRMDASPAEVALDEAYIGKYVNGYLNKAFTYDIHPPLGKMLLAGISSLSGKYDGSFPFEEVGDAFGNKVPFLAMRTAVAVMGALCAPVAYITLRNKGQSAPTAILASLLVAFAMSTKLPGILTVLTMGILAGWDMWGLIADESVSSSNQPYYGTSVHGDYDFTLLTPSFRHSLQSPYIEDRQEPVWSDIVFGSVIQLQSESQPPWDLLEDSVPGGEGRVELSCLKDAAVLSSSIWRFSMNDHDYPLYFSILLACTILSGIMRLSTMSRFTRAGIYLSLSLIVISAFIQLSPLTYGTLMSPEKCAALATKINPKKIPDPRYAGVAKGTPIPLIQPTLKLTCMTWSQHLSTTPLPPTNTSAPETFSEFKTRTELLVPKPIPRKRSPVLESIFPDKEMALPMEKVFMTPSEAKEEKAKTEKVRVEKERQETTAAEEEQQRYQEELKVLFGEQSRFQQIEAEKQRKAEAVAEELFKEAETKKAAHKAQQEQEESGRQRFHRQKVAFVAFDAAAKAAEVAAASKVAEHAENKKKVHEQEQREQAKVKAGEQAEPSREKLDQDFKFKRGNANESIPKEMRMVAALMPAAGELGGVGKQVFDQQQQQHNKSHTGTGSAAKPAQPIKKAPPTKPARQAQKAPPPAGNVESVENLITVLQQAQKDTDSKPAPHHCQQPSIPKELLDEITGLEKMTNDREASPEELLDQLGGLVNVMAKQQMNLGIGAGDLGKLQAELENLVRS